MLHLYIAHLCSGIVGDYPKSLFLWLFGASHSPLSQYLSSLPRLKSLGWLPPAWVVLWWLCGTLPAICCMAIQTRVRDYTGGISVFYSFFSGAVAAKLILLLWVLWRWVLLIGWVLKSLLNVEIIGWKLLLKGIIVLLCMFMGFGIEFLVDGASLVQFLSLQNQTFIFYIDLEKNKMNCYKLPY